MDIEGDKVYLDTDEKRVTGLKSPADIQQVANLVPVLLKRRSKKI